MQPQVLFRVLTGLKSVDWIVPFDQDTPDALLKLLRPHILATGGDFQPHEDVGANFARSFGGTMRVLGHVADCSMMVILERMPTAMPFTYGTMSGRRSWLPLSVTSSAMAKSFFSGSRQLMRWMVAVALPAAF